MSILGTEVPISPEAIAATLMTLAILILSEIIPKTLGANYWRRLTPFTVRSVKIITFILYPLVVFSQFITKRMKKDKNKSIFSRADFSAITEIGAKTGVIKGNESTIIRNLLRFETILTKDIMTPRTVVFALEANMKATEFFEFHQNTPFSRIPVYENQKDNIIGFVLKNEVFASLIKKEDNSGVFEKYVERNSSS